MEKIKYVHRQDSGFKLNAGNSGETSLNLSNEIFDLIAKGTLQLGEEKEVTFKIYKEDCIKAICFIILKLPLYQSSSNSSVKVTDSIATFRSLSDSVNVFFGSQESASYTVNLYYRNDGRIYLNHLRVNNFSIRDILVENHSALLFKDEADGTIAIRIISNIQEDEATKNENSEETSEQYAHSLQKIFYGAPGTGKSHTIKEQTKVAEGDNRVFRTTFHPDSDYATFVGCYKPTKVRKPVRDMAGNIALDKNKNEIFEESITYQFVPQAFTKAYIRAWQTNEPVYLIIEEINRGNCAQIFGDLFQLLDRDERGFSKYPIIPDTDLGNYIHEQLASTHRDDAWAALIQGKEMELPDNLYIWASMNTSDQSLFPIDSAFKRRWDWEYVPIQDAGKDYKIKVNGSVYDWWEFVQAINKEVLALTHSEDKQLGYFFVRPANGIIDANMLVNKVYFYLWNDVFKDYEIDGQKAFKKPDSEEAIAFKDFFEGGLDEKLAEQVLQNLELGEEIQEADE